VGRRTFAAVVAAAACLIAVLGFVAVDQRNEVDRMRDELAAPTTVPPPGAADIQVRLSGDDPRAGAQAVVTADGQGMLVSHDLPEVDPDQVFQLWGVVDETVLSLGTFDHRAEIVSFQLDPKRLDGVSAFAITLEQAPGVIASEQDALLAGTI
jgi:anti-sigma-K factor RskA